MNLTGWAAVLALPIAFVGGIWPIIRERSALAQLERIQALIRTAEKKRDLGHLVSARNELERRLAIGILVPRYLTAAAAAWFFIGLGFVLAWLFVSQIVMSFTWNWLAGWEGLGCTIIGAAILTWRQERRSKAITLALDE
jgi:hypothetical protein